MANVLIVAYLLIVLALIAVILLQRSEGGGLGMGGGGGSGLVSARGSASLLSRTTAILAALFMATAISLSIVASIEGDANAILDNVESLPVENNSVLDALNSLQDAGQDGSLPVPRLDPGETAPGVQDGAGGQDASLPVPSEPSSRPASGQVPQNSN